MQKTSFSRCLRTLLILGLTALTSVNCSSEDKAKKVVSKRDGNNAVPTASPNSQNQIDSRVDPQSSPDGTTPDSGEIQQNPAENSALLALHESNTESCIKCHESSRPSPDHFPGQDCVSCHKFPQFKGGLSSSGDPGSPPNSNGTSLLALHENNTNSCVKCHEAKRPSPTHYAGHDCASCHKFPSFKGGFFAHDPKPTSCEDCHARPSMIGRRAYPNQGPPANFNANDPKALGSGHYRGKDCLSCHLTPKEGATAFVFTHTSPNPQACLPCHFNDGLAEHGNRGNVMLSGFGNCQSCHQNFAKPNRNFDTN